MTLRSEICWLRNSETSASGLLPNECGYYIWGPDRGFVSVENQPLRDDRSTGKTRKDGSSTDAGRQPKLGVAKTASREPSATRRESCSGGARGPWSRAGER